ncbi:MAG: hypothetical protein K2I32_03820, partial [Alistipes sp.]|nr:hypothetical protein [Alistipes sp.]
YLIFIVSDIFTDCKSTIKKRFAKIFDENISKGPEKRPNVVTFVRLPIESEAPNHERSWQFSKSKAVIA